MRAEETANARGRIGDVWSAAASSVVTLLWAAPLAAFAARHAGSPPPAAWLPMIGLLVCAGLVAAARLPAPYYVSRRWESSHLYRRLGVRAFGGIVPDGRALKRIAGVDGRWLGRGDQIAVVQRRTCASERTHWWWLLTGLAVIVWAWSIEAQRTAALLLALNVPLNVYPILLQRYTRARIDRIAQRRAGRSVPTLRPENA
jgi:hypothetical protein